ncbi:MAG TPA: RNA polymerase sigma factor [Candidatus Doudnabacteria bacterium]|nr:RNA polymerase sigma factor [Candidatus Doudnabacteria bacterium]
MSAFAILYQRHHGRVYGICLQMLHNTHEAEDLTQDVFIQVSKKVASFRGDAQFTTWLHRLTVNQVLMHFRKGHVKLEKITSQGELPTDNSPEAIHARKNFIDEKMALEAAIEQLPNGYRNVFILHDVEGFEHTEVARILNCTEGTSKSQLFKARISLRKLLHRKANPRVYRIYHDAP